MSNNQCLKGKGLNKGLLPAFLIAEGSVGLEPDQSNLESLPEKPLKAFHMKITHDDTTTSTNSLSDFYGEIIINYKCIFVIVKYSFSFANRRSKAGSCSTRI